MRRMSRPIVGKLLAEFGRFRLSLIDFDRSSADFDRLGPHSTNFGRFSTKSWHVGPTLAGFDAKLGQLWPAPAKLNVFRPNLGQVGPHLWPDAAKLGLISTKFGPIRKMFGGRFRPHVVSFRPTTFPSSNFVLVSTGFGLVQACLFCRVLIW